MKAPRLIVLLLLVLMPLLTSAAEPKRILVVGATNGFRHASIPNTENMLRQLAEKSNGEFTFVFMSDDPNYPFPREPGVRPAPGAPPPDLTGLFQRHLGPGALQTYAGVLFVSTTGELPIPDESGFLDWVAAGHAVIGLHAATDRGDTSEAQMDMLSGGARFAGHPGGGTLTRRIHVVDRDHPATRDWPDGIAIVDEYYQFFHNTAGGRVEGLDRRRVHSLLDMDFDGRRLPVAWTKLHGRGRVFYTSLGHRDDVILPDTPSLDYGNSKMNPNEVSAAYQRHVLGGIRWALGLAEGDTTLGNGR